MRNRAIAGEGRREAYSCGLISVKIIWMMTVCLCAAAGILLSGCGRRDVVSLEDALAQQSSAAAEDAEADSDAVSEAGTPEGGSLYIHVCGAVARPGVVVVPRGSRAESAVEAAGGFLEDADTAYVNLAALLVDGQQLYVPTTEEAVLLQAQRPVQDNGLVNLNTADKDTLCTLPGIGESRAADIIQYRQENGGFKVKEDLMNVSGIKESIFEKLKDLITV